MQNFLCLCFKCLVKAWVEFWGMISVLWGWTCSSHDVHDVKLGWGTASGSEMENRLLENFAQCSNDGTLMEANGSLISSGPLQNCLYLVVFHLPHNEVPQM